MVKRELLVLALLMLAGAARAAGQVPENIFHHEHDPAPALGASWLGLEEADAVLRLAAPRLSLEVTNKGERELAVTLNVRLSADGARHDFQVAGGAVSPGGVRVIAIDMPGDALRLAGLRYAGRIDLTLVGSDAGGRVVGTAEAPALFYHPAGRELLVYRGQALRQRFGAGNFRGEQLPEVESSMSEVRRGLAVAGIGEIEPTLARVQTVNVLAGNESASVQPGQRRFCLWMTSDAFNDSSNREWEGQNGNVITKDYGEDYGRDGEPLPLARGWVSVSQQGQSVYTGYLDGGGCTPIVPGIANGAATMAFVPLYHRSGTDINGYVEDLNLGAAWPQTMPYFIFQLPATPWLVTWAFADPEEPALTLYTAAAAAMERFPGGHQNVRYGFRVGEEGNNTGTHTKYDSDGHPVVHVKYSTTLKSKFTIGHEYGHAVLMAKLNPQLTSNDLDYSVADGEANQHTLTSKEWQLTAAVEGFAHFVSAAIWNDVGPNADGVFVSGSDPNPNLNMTQNLNEFDRVFESDYNPASHPGQGVEMDWAQFFWNYHTDPVFPPSQQTLMAFWLVSYEWPKHEGFFADYYGAAHQILTLQTPAYLPPGFLTQRFISCAQAAGIIH